MIMDDTPTKRRRSPQEKKQLSYERDRVNPYGENDKASRKAIPRFKAASHREERRAARALVGKMTGAEDETQLDASLAALRAIPAPFDQAILGDDDAPGRRTFAAAISKPASPRSAARNAFIAAIPAAAV